MKTTKIYVGGMTCTSCEDLIKEILEEQKGVKSVKIDYVTQVGEIRYNENIISFSKLKSALKKHNYKLKEYDESLVGSSGVNYKLISIALGIILIGIVLYSTVISKLNLDLPKVGQEASFILLFLLGVLTSFHCIAMCGGFVISYSAKKKHNNVALNHLKYGFGKTLSYTVIGAIFGFIGSVFAFTPMMRGIAGILAGLFLILFGLNMLDVSKFFRRFRIHQPKFISRFAVKEKSKTNSPLIVGLLNGLMIACGPLQAMYIYAAGTGSMFYGAASLFAFGLGTLPVLLGFGFFTSLISGTMTKKILKASGVLVLILGLIMVNRGIALTGVGYDVNTLTQGVTAAGGSDSSGIVMEDGHQVIEMEVNRYGWSPDKFVIQKGIPVKWKINGKEINGCNNEIVIPKLGVSQKLKTGYNEITFTANEAGNLPFSCWMGMIPGVFVVKDDLASVNVESELESAPVASAGSCGGSCGSPSCGAATGGSCGASTGGSCGGR